MAIAFPRVTRTAFASLALGEGITALTAATCTNFLRHDLDTPFPESTENKVTPSGTGEVLLRTEGRLCGERVTASRGFPFTSAPSQGKGCTLT